MMRLRAGRITAELRPGGAGLRDVAVDGAAVFRGIAFVARDAEWGTFDLPGHTELSPGHGGLDVRAEGRIEAPGGDLDWRVTWRVGPDELRAEVRCTSHAGFTTNRTGLVVLHGLQASRGQPARARLTGGREADGAFPTLVAPHQPFLDLTGMYYVTAQGLPVDLAFDGDVFETEDQRNWTDASYKTYSRPLTLPRPYRIGPGEEVLQSVRIRFGPAGPPAVPGLRGPFVRVRARLPLLEEHAEAAHPGYFVERNRGPDEPPEWHWASSATVHAPDDDTIGETIEALPDLVATARDRHPGRRIRIAPLHLAHTPRDDPRRGTVLEAAWLLGTVAGYLDPAVERIGVEPPLGATAHLVARLRALAGAEAEAVNWPDQPRLRGLRFGTALAIAHVRDEEAGLELPPGLWGSCERLTAAGFVPAEPGQAKGFDVLWFTRAPALPE